MLGRMPRASERDRFGAGFWSVFFHLLLISAAVHAAREADASPPSPADPEPVVFVVAPTPVQPSAPDRGGLGSLSSEDRRGGIRIPRPAPPLPDITPPDVDELAGGSFDVGEREAWEAARESLTRGGPGRGGSAHPGDDRGSGSRGIHSVWTADRAARLRSGGPSPDFPENLRRAGVEGRVVVRFVVDSVGRVESGSVFVVSATHPAFADAVRRSLSRLSFVPAEHGGRPVRQLVEMPFAFTIER